LTGHTQEAQPYQVVMAIGVSAGSSTVSVTLSPVGQDELAGDVCGAEVERGR
jgi:hypothetical protein